MASPLPASARRSGVDLAADLAALDAEHAGAVQALAESLAATAAADLPGDKVRGVEFPPA